MRRFSGDGFSGLGDNTDYPYQIADNTTQFVDNVSWIKGKHTFKFGFEYNRQNFNQYGNQYLARPIHLLAERHAEPDATPAATLSPNFCWATCINPR